MPSRNPDAEAALEQATIDCLPEAGRLDWRKQQRTRAEVRVTIEKVLDDKLPTAYDAGWFRQKCTAVYEQVYEKYQGDGRSVYAGLN